MITELYHSNPGFYIPEHAGHIARTSDDLTIVEESATTEIT
jgi:hypothetical protein